MSLQPPTYRQAALEKYKSPQPLEEIPQLTPLRAWVALAALACLIAAALLWGIFGTIVTHIETQGVVQTGSMVVTLDAAQAVQVQPGMVVRAVCADESFTGTVRAVTYNDQQLIYEVAIVLDTFPSSDTSCTIFLIIREERSIQRVFPVY